MFPPQCCNQPIPLESARPFISPVTIVHFRAKRQEFETPDRTYCWVSRCSTFIPLYNIRGQEARCPVCQAKTCTQCKGRFHENGDCPKDEATQQVLQVAREQGWRRCNACHRIIELATGCYHISMSSALLSSFYFSTTALAPRLLT
jgi:hypothetical protein